MRSLAREESEESPEESDLKKLTSVTDVDRDGNCQERHFPRIRWHSLASFQWPWASNFNLCPGPLQQAWPPPATAFWARAPGALELPTAKAGPRYHGTIDASGQRRAAYDSHAPLGSQ